MKYQLILQLPASSINDYDAMIELEDSIIEGLGKFGEVDGHDAGSGEINIFIHTDSPEVAFKTIKKIPSVSIFLPELRVAYRELDKDEFIILYPPDLTNFIVT